MASEPTSAPLFFVLTLVPLTAADDAAEAETDVVDALAAAGRVEGMVLGVAEVDGVAEVVSLADTAEDGPGTEPDGVEGSTPAGGGTAVEGSARAPMPHGIAAFVPG